MARRDRAGWKITAAAALLYFLSTWIHFPPPSQGQMEDWPALDLGVAVIAPPWVLSGDSPHYLAMVHSLSEDADLDLQDEYAAARQGGRQAGQRFRGAAFDPHAEEDDRGRLLPTHSPVLPALLALLSWPLAGSLWIEPWCIWLTTAAGLACLAWTAKRLQGRCGESSWKDWLAHPVLLLGLASPLWCYSVDLWTEPWTALAWMGLLFFKHPAALLAAGVAGTLIKFPFALVPAAMGLWAWYQGERTRAVALAASSALGLTATVAMVQWLYRDFSDHFSLFHSGIHAGFDWPFDGMLGLLFSPESGLLFFFPVLAWPLWRILSGDTANPADHPAKASAEKAATSILPRPKEALCGLAAFFLVHAAYEDWAGGTGFSARYLVPALPLLVLWTQSRFASSRLYQTALAYSALWSAVGGLAPALVYDRSPWGVILHGINYLSSL